MSHVLISVPSYFDCASPKLLQGGGTEWTSPTSESTTQNSSVSSARHFFLQGGEQFLFPMECFHFYKRYTTKGIRILIFCELPACPHFCREICNMLKAIKREEAMWTCTHYPLLPVQCPEINCHGRCGVGSLDAAIQEECPRLYHCRKISSCYWVWYTDFGSVGLISDFLYRERIDTRNSK
jgi:hypothetical protein